MLRRAFLAGVLFCGSANFVLADFTYEQTSKITGGMMAGMMKFAGAFSKQAREPMRSTIIVKGDRMATISADRIHVIDLSKETMTDIDLKNKTYSVITFADMARAMAKMSEKMSQKGASDADLNFKLDVKDTGATRNISGFNTKEKILTIEMEGTDKKSGQKGGMTLTTDMWLAPSLPGYEEVRNFYGRMATKMAWTPGSGMLGALASQPGMTKGFSELYKQASKLDGVPMLQVVRMTPIGAPQAGMPTEAEMAQAQSQAAQAQAAQAQQPPPPTVGEAAGNAAGSAAAGAALGKLGKLGGLGGMAGGFGGFGRKKKAEPQQTAAAPPPPPPAAPAATAPPSTTGSQGSAPAGTLMELTTETSGFSTSPADGSKFEVPAGFKQVESDMQKALK